MTSSLPVASSWLSARTVAPGITLIDEPHVHSFLRANIWWIQGQDRDLIVDTGLGVVSLRDHWPDLFAHDPLAVITHAHLDHVGGAHEFRSVAMSAFEDALRPIKASLRGPRLAEALGTDSPLPELLIDAIPSIDYDIDAYAIPEPNVTHPLNDGDVIDLGDRSFTVLVLAGHTPGSVVLHDVANRALFSGDVVYDGELLDDLPESDIPAYLASMERLSELDVDVVYPGHGDPFDGQRLAVIVRQYLDSRSSHGSPRRESGSA